MRYAFFLFVLFSSCTYNELVTICEPDEQVFLDVVQPIIQNSCVECHNELSGRPAILTTYDGVIDAIKNHELRDEVVSLRMPKQFNPPLTELEINTLTSWIDCE